MVRPNSFKQGRQLGFTLIELMVVIAIIGILAAIATPMYSQYVIRGKFSEVKLAVYPVKSAITDCYQRNAGSANCNKVHSSSETFLSGQVTASMLARAATSNIVSEVTLGTGAIPVIQATVITTNGFNGETYTLTGTVAGTPGSDARVEDWTEGGTACTLGWC